MEFRSKTNIHKNKSNWSRNKEKTTFARNKITKKKITKSKKKKITTRIINHRLKHIKTFIGTYSMDELQHLHIRDYPVIFVLNLDSSSQTGSHWISIYITKNTFEIWCNLGFQKESWSTFPAVLFNFISRYHTTHILRISPVLQTYSSHLCGLYAIFFVLNRDHHTFGRLVSYFTSDPSLNDKILLDYFE